MISTCFCHVLIHSGCPDIGPAVFYWLDVLQFSRFCSIITYLKMTHKGADLHQV